MDQSLTADAGSIAAGSAGKARAPARNNAARLFGYDVFISFALGPPPRGSHSYASDLARRLRERDFTVFFSEDVVPPGERLNSTLSTALKRSKTLVVIANRGTLEDPRWVRTEVEDFRRMNPTGRVIPINVGGALQDPALAQQVEPWLGFHDKIWLDESEGAAASGIASDGLVERLAIAPSRVRSNVKWRWVVRAVVATLAGLAIALGIAAVVAKNSAERARAELRRSTAQRLAAASPVMLKGDQVGGAELALQQLLAAHVLAPSLEVDAHLQTAVLMLANVNKLIDTESSVRAVAYSPDGAQIVSDHVDGTLRRWDAVSGRLIGPPSHRTTPADAEFASVAISADNRFIVEGDLGGNLKLRALAGGEDLAARADAHKQTIGLRSPAAAFSQDGTRIVSGGEDGFRLWDAATLAPIGGLRGDVQRGGVQAVAFSRDGALIVTGGGLERSFYGAPEPDKTDRRNSTLRLWNARTKEPIDDFGAGAAPGNVESVAFSPDGAHVVSGGSDGAMRLWDVKRGEPIGPPLVAGFRDGVRSVAYSPDGSRIVLGGADGVLAILNGQGHWPIGAPLQGPEDQFDEDVHALAFSSDDALIVASDANGHVRSWDRKTGRQAAGAIRLRRPASGTDELMSGEIPGLAISRDGTRVVSSSADDGTLQLWDGRTLQNGRTLQPSGMQLKRHQDDVRSLALSPSGSMLVSGGVDGSLHVWDLQENIRHSIVDPPKGPAVHSVAFSSDGARVAVGRSGGQLQLWDAKTRQQIASAQLQGRELAGRSSEDDQGTLWVAFNARDGSRVISVYRMPGYRAVRVWNSATLEPFGPLIESPEGGRGIRSVAFSPDGNMMAWGDVNGSVQRWNTQNGQRVGQPLKGHAGAVHALEFSADGNHLVSAGYDGTLRLWDADSGLPIGAPFRGHEGEGGVKNVALSVDGSLIASGGVDKRVRLWPGRRSWAPILCSKLTRNMSRAQWKALVSHEIGYEKQCAGLPDPD